MHIFQHLLARRKLNAEKPLKLEMPKAPWNEMWKKKKKVLFGEKRGYFQTAFGLVLELAMGRL